MADDDEPGITVTQAMTEVDPPGIKNTSPKKYITAALGAGFQVRAGITKTLETRPAFKTGERAGQPRPDVVIEHLWVLAKHKIARFKLHFIGGRFESAWVWDLAGWPVELYYDYSPSANDLKQVKDEPYWAWQERVRRLREDVARREYEYNDNALHVIREMRLVTVGQDLDEWLAELVPSFTVRKRKQKEEVDMLTAPITAGEWIG